ncbi:hypothetical protein [Algoriphagus sp. A40]|uniref:hypothetical protein n=1 Tax=Algoriphagus sp. A40 TaxID=1945863 RepID=UPI0009858505|nr:hypothetical protein [Algoriphagus sp. A40]OOG73071.1 hypothetical protein B0E43_14215 [Algoriphagus sp. A40]
MAINLIACTYYGQIQLTAEELVETNPLQELLEKEVKMFNEYMLPAFSLEHPFLKIDSTFYFTQNSNGFSSYVQEIHVPPPNFQFFS